MAREDRGERRRSRWSWDQIILTMMLWFVPIGLFGYVGFQIAAATGRDPYQYVPSIALWQVAVFVGVLVIALGGFIGWRLSVARAAEADGYEGR